MTSEAFDSLMTAMVPLKGDLCPQSPPQPNAFLNPFNDKIAPDLSCPKTVGGGRKKTNKIIKKQKNITKKSNKPKKPITTRRNKRYTRL